MIQCIKCGKKMFDGVYSGIALTKDSIGWTCGDCAKTEDWLILKGEKC